MYHKEQLRSNLFLEFVEVWKSPTNLLIPCKVFSNWFQSTNFQWNSPFSYHSKRKIWQKENRWIYKRKKTDKII